MSQIARWGVLAAGLSYGFVHARSLRNDANAKRIDDAYAHKVALIEEAKKKFAEAKAPNGSAGEQFNFDDPNFDADKWAKHIETNFK
ncbi:hypothetical protein IWW50_006662 [Coemansia erecta]|nr:hypothetical protein IWW50_006662 [Coemansia erecta]